MTGRAVVILGSVSGNYAAAVRWADSGFDISFNIPANDAVGRRLRKAWRKCQTSVSWTFSFWGGDYRVVSPVLVPMTLPGVPSADGAWAVTQRVRVTPEVI